MADRDAVPEASSGEDPDLQEPSAEIISSLFHEHNRALVGYLTARLRSEHEAKEVAQEAYVRLLQLHKPGTASLFRAYLFKTATNLAIDRLRRRAVRQRAETGELFDELNDDEIREAHDPANQLLVQERTDELLRCLAELPPKCQNVFRLHRIEGLDQRKVAALSGFSERMVRRYVTYAMVYCRLRLGGMPAERVRKEIEL